MLTGRKQTGEEKDQRIILIKGREYQKEKIKKKEWEKRTLFRKEKQFIHSFNGNDTEVAWMEKREEACLQVQGL